MNARACMLFATVSVLWGVPYLFIKLAVDGGFTPLALAWTRLVIGAAILLAVGGRRGGLRAVRSRWRPVLVYAVVELAIPLPLIAFGERRIASSLAAIIIATVPLLVALLALRLDPSERVSGRRLVGLLVGLIGVVLLVGVDATGSGRALVAVLAVLIAAVGYATGPLVLQRHLSGLEPASVMGASLAAAAVILTPFAAVDLPHRAPTVGAFGSVLALGVLCTAAAFLTIALLIAAIGVSRAVLITYVNPVVALALGVVLLGERPGAPALGGLVLILAGSALAGRRGGATAAPTVDEVLDRADGLSGGATSFTDAATILRTDRDAR